MTVQRRRELCRLEGHSVNLALVDKAKHAYGLLGMYAFAIQIARRTLLVWYDEAGTVTFHVLAVDSLTPLGPLTKTAAKMDTQKRRWVTRDPAAGQTLTLRARKSGPISARIPGPLSDVEEICFFVRSGSVRLWRLRPKARRLEIIPQDWFNKGPFDFSFQWPTRVARDPATGRFVVDGIRLGVYVIDKSGQKIAEQLA